MTETKVSSVRQRYHSFGHWLAGFTDGEGCFVIRFQRKFHLTEAGLAETLRLKEKMTKKELGDA